MFYLPEIIEAARRVVLTSTVTHKLGPGATLRQLMDKEMHNAVVRGFKKASSYYQITS